MLGLGLLDGVVFCALLLGVTVLGVVGQLLRMRRRRRSPAPNEPRSMAAAGLDVLSVLFSPTYKHRLEYDESQEVTRDEPGEDAPPRSQVDLNAGLARLVLPPPPSHDG